MKTDYKFWYVKRDDDGFITEATVRFYEGDYGTKKKINYDTGEYDDVVAYIRTKKLTKNDLGYTKSKKFKADALGGDVLLYTPEDFGNINTDDELRAFMNTEIKKDKSREPIPEQWQP